MPAKSKAQQRFFGMVHAYQKGELDHPSKAIKDAAKSISKKDAKHFAETKHKGLPNHVKKSKKKTNENKAMKKNIIKINEQQLKKMIAESVKKILNEINGIDSRLYFFPRLEQSRIIKQGEKDGYKWKIVSTGYYPCYYVTLCNDHPFWGLSYNDMESWAPDGSSELTFYNPEKGTLGWDCGHYDEYHHGREYNPDYVHAYTLEELEETVNEIINYLKDNDNDETRMAIQWEKEASPRHHYHEDEYDDYNDE